MKLLALGLAAWLAAPASAGSSYRRTGGASYRRGGSRATSRVTSFSGRRSGFSQQASGGGAAGAKAGSGTTTTAAADPVPGWLANPTPGALIRTGGLPPTLADGGGVKTNLDYSRVGWGAAITGDSKYAQNATGVGTHIGPPDKAPYPAGSGGGSAGGNGITTNGPVLGLDAGGNTIVNGGNHGGNANSGNGN